MFTCLAICATCACHLIISTFLLLEESTFLFVSGGFCVCFTQICTCRMWVALLGMATIRPLWSTVHVHFFHEKWNILRGHSKTSSFLHFISYIAIISGVTRALSQGGKLSWKGATVQGPLSNTRKKTWEMTWIRMWIAMIKPWITGKSKKRKKTNKNQTNTKTEISFKVKKRNIT